MSSPRDKVIKEENGTGNDYDPLEESRIDIDDTVVKKRKFKKIDEEGEDFGWTHEYEETVVRELRNFPCLWDTKLAIFSKRNVCDPARKHIVFMLKQNHPNASSEIHDKLFTPQSVGRKTRNLRLAYKKIWQRDGSNAKWRHFKNLTFLQSRSTNMDTEIIDQNDQEFQYDDSCYEPPFVTSVTSLNCSGDETTHNKPERHSSPLTSKSPEIVTNRTTEQQMSSCTEVCTVCDGSAECGTTKEIFNRCDETFTKISREQFGVAKSFERSHYGPTPCVK